MTTSNARLKRELEVVKELKKKPKKPLYRTYKEDAKTSMHSCLWCQEVFNAYRVDNFANLEAHVMTKHMETGIWESTS